MKIALVAEHVGEQPDLSADAYPGDPAARIRSLATALAGLDHQVTVYSRRGRAELAEDAGSTRGVSVELVRAGTPEKLDTDRLLSHVGTFARRLGAAWRQNPPDIVHAHDWISGLAALGGARDLGIPVVQTFGSPGTDLRRGPGKHARDRSDRARLEAGIGRSASAVLAGTSDDLFALVRRGLPQAAVKIVPAGVDTTRFQPHGPAAQRTARHRLLMFAPLAERQIVAAALHALVRVPDAELVIATGLPSSQLRNAPCCREVTGLARELGLRDRLTLAGSLSQAQAPAILRSADILVSPAGSEPFAMVPIEAMACGIPVIASAAGAQRDAVIHGTTGFLVQPTEPDLLTRRIRQLLASPMLREGCGIAAATRARARYSWERIGLETLAVYEALPRPLPTASAA